MGALIPYPHPCPHGGDTLRFATVLCSQRFVVVWPLGGIPDFGWFIGSRGSCKVEAALAKNLPHRSRENEFTDGRVGKLFSFVVRRIK